MSAPMTTIETVTITRPLKVNEWFSFASVSFEVIWVCVLIAENDQSYDSLMTKRICGLNNAGCIPLMSIGLFKNLRYFIVHIYTTIMKLHPFVGLHRRHVRDFRTRQKKTLFFSTTHARALSQRNGGKQSTNKKGNISLGWCQNNRQTPPNNIEKNEIIKARALTLSRSRL